MPARESEKASLKEGFTTGTAAAAAAKAATLYLLSGTQHDTVETPMPPEAQAEGAPALQIPVQELKLEGETATAVVRKDAGDDPDVTHNALIIAEVSLAPGAAPGSVEILGGAGVGVATLPGLPVAVGEPAINPAPRAQIHNAVAQTLAESGYDGGATVTIEVPEGERLAQKTMNPRLGILGGISILGTRGTVKPFSHEAYEATIRQGLDCAHALGLPMMVFSTGRRTERLYQERRPELPLQSFVQIADFFSFSVREAAARGFTRIHWAVFFAKMVKMAQGFEYTHAHSAKLDFSLLAAWCAESGIASPTECEVAAANTARQVLEMAKEDPALPALFDLIFTKAMAQARVWAALPPERLKLGVTLFDFDETLLFERMDA